MILALRKKPHNNESYFQCRLGHQGPLGPGHVKIEISREKFIGRVVSKNVPNSPPDFDYPSFQVRTYSLETIVAEKTRTLLERGYVRDYYDVWRLFKEEKFDIVGAKKLFAEKCKAKRILVSGIDQFFPESKLEELSPYLPQLARLSREPLPALEQIFEELRNMLTVFLN